ncbi:hypothetical protein HKX41_11745, partial [Salinisphaera sp. USBA-960]|nr:hypothetical protein [Salifodinibacter halophilus]
GFKTGTNNEEVSAGPNARIYVLDSVQDVTAKVQSALAAAADPAARMAALFPGRTPGNDGRYNPNIPFNTGNNDGIPNGVLIKDRRIWST